MRVVGNIFKDIGAKVRPAFGRFGGRVVDRGEQHATSYLDDELPDLSEDEDDGEGDLGGGEGNLGRGEGRLNRGEGNLGRGGGRLNTNRRRGSVPPATRGEVLDAAQGMVDALAGLPMTRGVEAALSGLGVLVNGIAGYGTDPLDAEAFAAYQKKRRRMESEGGIHGRARRLARQLREAEEEGSEGFMGYGEVDRWGSRADADQFNNQLRDQFTDASPFNQDHQQFAGGRMRVGDIAEQWGPGLWDDDDQFDGDDEDMFGSGYERENYGYGRNRGFVGGVGNITSSRRRILDGNVDDFDESAVNYVDGYGDDDDCDGLVSIGNIFR